MSKGSPNRAGSINGRDAAGEGSSSSQQASAAGGAPRSLAVQNIINNNGGWTNRNTRETSPLITTVSVDMPNGQDARSTRSRIMSRMMQLLGVVIVVCAVLFGILAFRRGQMMTTGVPFPSVTHPFKPVAAWGPARRPYPTGAWWLNLMMGEGDQNVATLPYAIKATKDMGIGISYSHWRHLSTETVEADLFAPDLIMSSVENVTDRYLESYDPVSVGLVFKTDVRATGGGKQQQQGANGAAFFRTTLVRGCPYITAEYHGTRPNISSEYPITTINGLLMNDNQPRFLPRLTGESFDCTVISGQHWMLFANPPITLTWSPQGLVAEEPYYGYIRAAYVPDAGAKDLLELYWRAYPTGAQVLLDYNSKDESIISIQWRKKGSHDKLLMLALPHHVEQLQGAELVDIPGPYLAMKGPMQGVVGDKWYLKESVPSIRWTAPRQIQDPAKLSAIKSALPGDVVLRAMGKDKGSDAGEDPEDPYWAGKEMGRLARLALIADELGMPQEAAKAVSLAEQVLEPWLVGDTSNPLLYDAVWGGIIIKNGLKDPLVNFGNSYYNDHHFQYGYFIYTAAVIAKLDPAFVRKYRAKLDAIVSDVVNYDEASPHFPVARHKDFYDGHSWASGLFVQNNGKSQESSSEAINCYYAAMLYGHAVGNRALERFGGLLLAMEIRSTKRYWHMKTNGTVYDPVFAANKMVGVVGATDVTSHTWFGTKFEYVHGINFMPFTPITEAYLDKSYVEEEYAVLATVLTRTGSDGPVDEAWKSLIYLDHAILDPNAAWSEVLSLKTFDSGNTLTNSLYWVASRPDAGPPPTPAASSSSSSSSSATTTSSSSSSKGSDAASSSSTTATPKAAATHGSSDSGSSHRHTR